MGDETSNERTQTISEFADDAHKHEHEKNSSIRMMEFLESHNIPKAERIREKLERRKVRKAKEKADEREFKEQQKFLKEEAKKATIYLTDEQVLKVAAGWAGDGKMAGDGVTQAEFGHLVYEKLNGVIRVLPEEGGFRSFVESTARTTYRTWKLTSDFIPGVSTAQKTKALADTKQNAAIQGAMIAYDVATDVVGKANTGLSAVAHLGVIPAVAVSVTSPVGAGLVAAGAWGAAGYSAYTAARGGRYYFSKAAWFKHEVSKLESMEKTILKHERKIEKLNVKRENKHAELDFLRENHHPDDPKIKKAEKHLAKIEGNITKRTTRLNYWNNEQDQVMALATVIGQMKNKDHVEKNKKPLSEKLTNRFTKAVTTVQIRRNPELREAQKQEKKELNELSEKKDASQQGQKTEAQLKMDQARDGIRFKVRKQLRTDVDPQEEKIFKELRANKRGLLIDRVIDTVGTTLIATGATITTVGATGVAAQGTPAVIGAGIAVTAAGSILIVGNKVITNTINFDAVRYQHKLQRKELTEIYQTDGKFSVIDEMTQPSSKETAEKENKGAIELDELNKSTDKDQAPGRNAEKPVDEILTKEQKSILDKNKLKFRLAFELSYEGFSGVKLNNKNKSPEEREKWAKLEKQLEIAYYKKLLDMPKRKRNKILDSAEQKIFNERLLSKGLGDLPIDDERMKMIPQKDKMKIIQRYSRKNNQYILRTKLRTKKIAKGTQEIVVDASTAVKEKTVSASIKVKDKTLVASEKIKEKTLAASEKVKEKTLAASESIGRNAKVANDAITEKAKTAKKSIKEAAETASDNIGARFSLKPR